VAHEPLKRSDVFPGASVSDADWEDVLLRAVLEARGVDLAAYPDIKLSCTGIRGRSNDAGEEFVFSETHDQKGYTLSFYRPRLDSAGYTITIS